jgi:tape measure domain-containing protein
MANIDDKVVSMSFEGSKFESGVRSTLSVLDKLKQALKFEGASKGLNDVSNASKRVDFSRMASALDTIKNRLGAFRLAAIAAFAQIASRAISSGAQFIKSFTIAPILQGLDIYQTKLQSIQTVLANTQSQGTKMSDVTKALQELNKYSNLTIYNFGQMAKNIGTFTAAGVNLDTSVAAIKGIANLAALSGSSADQASMAMYQLSQAIAAGRVSLQDWNSVVNAGMGGAVFQKALAETAQAMGALKDGSVKLVGPMKQLKINGESFRQSIGGPGPKWLTSDILTTTLKNFTGDMTVAQLKAEGFNEAQIKSIQTTAQVALHAATQVKTIGQVFDIAKETAATGWATTFELIFGSLDEAKATFTGLSNAINGFIQKSADARNKVLGDWKALGGRTVLINGIKDAFQALGDILRPIKQAFRDIFPATTGKNLFDMTVRFKELMDALKPSQSTIDNIRSTFRGLFAVLDIGKQIVTGIFTVIGQLIGSLGVGNGGVLKFTAGIGDFLVKIDEALKKGNAFHNFFVGLGNVLSVPVQLIGELAHAIATLFSGFSPGGFSGKMSSITKATTPFKQLLDNIGQSLQGLGPAISNAISNINWDTVLAIVRTGLLGGFVLMMKNFIGGSTLPQLFGIMGKNIGRNFGGGILKNINKSFGSLTGTLTAMQQNLKAKTLEEIAISIALLAASVLALSLINPDKLSGALGAMTIMFAELLAAMAIMDKITGAASFVKLPFIAASLVLLATALDLLTLSVLALSRLSWNELIKGLTGVGGLLFGLAAASTVLSKNSAGMIRSGIGIMAIAVAMKILASAMADFGAMNWTQLAKGLVGIAGGLAAIAGTMQLMPRNMVLRSASLIAVAAALEIIANAVGKFGGMNLSTLGKGLAGIGGSLVVIAAAMHLMPKSMVLTGAGLLLVALSLGKIESAVQKMGGMSLKQIGKGLIGLAGALIILAAALTVMSGTVSGAIALGLAATGLSLLVGALAVLGRQSWTSLLKGLIGLAGAIAIIAAAAILLTPALPSLLGFGAALVVIGAGLALAGAGIALIGVGLSAIAVSGSAAIGILIKSLTDLIQALVDTAKNLVLGVLEIVKAFANTAPQFAKALGQIIDTILNVIVKEAPKIAQAFQALLLAALQLLNDNSGKVIQAGMNLILALLTGIRNNANQIITAVVDIITRILSSIASNLGRIITAGVSIVTSLVKGIANNLANVVSAALSIVTRFLDTIANNLGRIATAGINIITRLLSAISGRISEVISLGTTIIVRFIDGIGNASARIVSAGVRAITEFINAITRGSLKLVNAGAQAIIKFMNGVAAALNRYEPQMIAAGGNIGIAIVRGMVNGLLAWAPNAYNTAKSIGSKVLSLLGKAVHLGSPSKATYDMGVFIVQGLANGMNEVAPALAAAEDLGNSVISMFKDIFKIASPSKVMQDIGDDVGQGFAKGIRGSNDDVKKAFADLNSKMIDSMRSLREDIASEQEKVNKLRASGTDSAAFKEAQKALEADQSALERLTAAHSTLVNNLSDEKQRLLKLGVEYGNVTETLKKAKDTLAEAMKTRDDAIKTFTEQYSTLPDIVTQDAEGNSVDTLATYIQALKNQADAVTAYQSTLDQLRQLGLDDATYQKLLKEGPADQQFAAQLLAGGKNAVTSLNDLDERLMKVSGTLATNAAKNLYQAGVDAAQGLVNGLENRRSHVRRIMEDIAEEMLRAIKSKLKIKSPSEVFAEIGSLAMDGMAEGFRESDALKESVDQAAQEALQAMKDAMIGIPDMNPVITPVVDLSGVQRSIEEILALMNGTTLTASASFGQASAIASQQTSGGDAVVASGGGTSVTFEQNNYSPEALSEVEIYRQTKNQLSQLKSALAV